ncbi:MAG: hypothetical protein GOMPHAMPRED_004124 [Gomphillus americanus]|uniref:Uncharacterized protein n=1 Tax=Gomphillus americanus TaxID=1940652 RepID=A0A8H3FM88_9LECA|nr:MAG: hypothetical protein GOMPHAMPRED_004124 [Gomphillus americanus]
MRRNHIGEKVAVLTRLIAGATLPSGLVDPSVETALEHGVDTSKSEKRIEDVNESQVKIGSPESEPTRPGAKSKRSREFETDAEEVDLYLADESENEYDSDART